MPDESHPTLAWPAHDRGPTPPPHTTEQERGELKTRKKLAPWDRLKFIILLTLLFFMFVWADMANIPILPFRDALRRGLEGKWWMIALLGLEILRQFHYII